LKRQAIQHVVFALRASCAAPVSPAKSVRLFEAPTASFVDGWLRPRSWTRPIVPDHVDSPAAVV
jgi:hypothetical protein